MAAVLSLAACTPAGRAVGDTQDSMPEVAHDSTHPTDVTVGFVGSTDTAADEFVINALSDDKLNVYYASLETSASSANATDGVSGETESSDAGTTSENGADSMDAHTGVDKNAVTAQQGVADFVARAVKIVVISGIDVTDANRESWNQTLTMRVKPVFQSLSLIQSMRPKMNCCTPSSFTSTPTVPILATLPIPSQ